MAQGACLCGAVSFELDGPYRWMAHCHCSMCRTHHGALFSTSLGVDRGRIELRGAKWIVLYRSSPAFVRAFCRRCGAKVPADSQRADVVNVPAGAVDGLVGARPRTHIFVASKSPWTSLDDSLPRYRAYPPGVDVPETERARSADVAGAGVAGGCLCGAVGYRIEGGLLGAFHCHCSRCRRSRGAAYATTATAPLESLRFTRGETAVAYYALPECSYSTAFCRHCGSLLPAPARDTEGAAFVPVGSLRTPLASGPAFHVHVESKAQWHEITDMLPRFPGACPPGAIGGHAELPGD
jgi:hypothetical protein